MVTKLDEQAPVRPPAYHRAPARQAGLLTDAVTLVTTLHVWPLFRIAVRLAHWRCPPPCLPDQEGPHVATVRRSLLLIALLPTPWRISYQDVHDWVRVCFIPGEFWLLSCSGFGATPHNAAHNVFMTLPAYTTLRWNLLLRKILCSLNASFPISSPSLSMSSMLPVSRRKCSTSSSQSGCNICLLLQKPSSLWSARVRVLLCCDDRVDERTAPRSSYLRCSSFTAVESMEGN
jgi:hypothetical protein